MHYMFNGDITSVEMKFARMNTLNPNGESLREPQLAIVEFSDGALATAEANVNCQYGYDIQCRLVGESGIISLPDVATPEVRKAGQISHAISSAWFDRFIEAYDREFDRFFANIEADRQPGGKEATAWDGYVADVVADAALDSLHHGGRIPVTLNEQPALYR
nr:Gfo/Idh/MocA family oxidoreductase [Bifidobacterium bifidum]